MAPAIVNRCGGPGGGPAWRAVPGDRRPHARARGNSPQSSAIEQSTIEVEPTATRGALAHAAGGPRTRPSFAMAALDINFGRTQMMQRELASQQDFTVGEIFGARAASARASRFEACFLSRDGNSGRVLAPRAASDSPCVHARRRPSRRQAERPARQDVNGQAEPGLVGRNEALCVAGRALHQLGLSTRSHCRNS